MKPRSSSHALRPGARVGPLLMALLLPGLAGCQQPPAAPPARVASLGGGDRSAAVPRSSTALLPVALPAPRRAAPVGHNGCMTNGFYPPNLVAHPLNSDSITNIPELHEPLCDPRSQAQFENIVECALDSKSTLTTMLDDGTKLEFKGLMGFAPEWANGVCNRECQEWVSACFAARINAYGVPVQILFKAPKPGSLYDDPQDPKLTEEFPNEEAAFYGNLFGPGGPTLYSCRGRGTDPLYLAVRACANEDALCIASIKPVGTCDFFNPVTGVTGAERACEGGAPGSHFVNCHRGVGPDGSLPGPAFTRPITIYTRRSSFGARPGGC